MPESYTGDEGNDAQAAGLDVMDGGEKVRGTNGGWRGVNKTRDMIVWALNQAKAYADSLFGSISLSWGAITGKPATFPPSSHSLASHSGSLAVDRLSSGVMAGNFGATGNVEMNGNLRSTGVRVNAISSWINVGVDPSGFLGQTSSTARMKENIEDFEAGGDIDAVRPRRFNWIAWPDLEPDHGVIAEELISAGYGWLVTLDENGEPFGVRHELAWIALIPELQKLRARVSDLEARGDA